MVPSSITRHCSYHSWDVIVDKAKNGCPRERNVFFFHHGIRQSVRTRLLTVHSIPFCIQQTEHKLHKQELASQLLAPAPPINYIIADLLRQCHFLALWYPQCPKIYRPFGLHPQQLSLHSLLGVRNPQPLKWTNFFVSSEWPTRFKGCVLDIPLGKQHSASTLSNLRRILYVSTRSPLILPSSRKSSLDNKRMISGICLMKYNRRMNQHYPH